jgi:hypothetical protein
VPVHKAADNVFAVIGKVDSSHAKGETFAWRKRRDPIDPELQAGDAERLWTATTDLLHPFLGGR